jgi:hypothetical protein
MTSAAPFRSEPRDVVLIRGGIRDVIVHAGVHGIDQSLGSAVATIVVAKWESAIDDKRFEQVLDGDTSPAAL